MADERRGGINQDGRTRGVVTRASKGRDPYWERAVARWDHAEEAVSSRPRTAEVNGSWWQAQVTRFLGPQVSILITGERGAGKTELFRALTGALPGRKEGVSEKREELRAAVNIHQQKTRATFIVVPGQDADPDGTMLADVFDLDDHDIPHRMPSGVIHVVSGGYDVVWGDKAAEVVEDRLLKRRRDQAAKVARLEAIAEPRPADVKAELDGLRAEQAKSLGQQALEDAQGKEFKRFESLCDKLYDGWGSALPDGQPWLIIAVTKFDLWFHKREEVKSYYLPQYGNPTDFSNQLEQLVSYAQIKPRVAVVPVVSHPKSWMLRPKLGHQKSQLDEQATESLLNNFRNLVGEFCGRRN